MNGGSNSTGSKLSDFNISGSWRHRQVSENEEGLFFTPIEQRLCYCGLKVVCLTSRTNGNPGKRFYTCPMTRRGQQCGFFVGWRLRTVSNWVRGWGTWKGN
ncbi:Zinc finger, GRF-type [Sesbania bispinosa]|nr:Zinc finger, GRF-type [Sesbania bispinosa]